MALQSIKSHLTNKRRCASLLYLSNPAKPVVFITFSDMKGKGCEREEGTRVEKRHFKASKKGGVVRGVKEVTATGQT